MNLDYRFHPETIASDAWIAPTATVCGKVRIGERSSVWFSAVIRGDCEWIELGNDVNVQDGAILHADAGIPCRLGDRVSLGHGAIVHGAIVESDCMIGIRATVLNRAVIGSGSLIAAGALIPEGMVVPPGSLVMGVPGKIVREVTERDTARIAHAWQHYCRAAAEARSQMLTSNPPSPVDSTDTSPDDSA